MNCLNVLMLDDSVTFLQAAEELLRRAGINASRVGSWIDLGPAMQRQPPDLLILDINMPGFEGDQIGRMIRRFSQCPILFLSSESTDRLSAICGEIPGTAFLEKRLLRERLVSVVLGLTSRGGRAARAVQT